MKHFEQTAIIDQIDHLGLGADEQGYLKFVASRNGSAVRLFTIESAIGVHLSRPRRSSSANEAR